MSIPETYHFANISGDQKFVEFIYERMKHKYAESDLLDYMHTLHSLMIGINEVVHKAKEYDRIKASLETIQKSLRY